VCALDCQFTQPIHPTAARPNQGGVEPPRSDETPPGATEVLKSLTTDVRIGDAVALDTFFARSELGTLPGDSGQEVPLEML
jgi:hypothetical protein